MYIGQIKLVAPSCQFLSCQQTKLCENLLLVKWAIYSRIKQSSDLNLPSPLK